MNQEGSRKLNYLAKLLSIRGLRASSIFIKPSFSQRRSSRWVTGGAFFQLHTNCPAESRFGLALASCFSDGGSVSSSSRQALFSWMVRVDGLLLPI